MIDRADALLRRPVAAGMPLEVLAGAAAAVGPMMQRIAAPSVDTARKA